MPNIPPPLYPLTIYDVFRRMPDLGFLDPSDVSFNAHVQRMLDYASAADPTNVWKDFFTNTDGRIVLEWIAGVSAYKQFNELMTLREKSLDTALTLSGVTEAAFNRGYLLGPQVGAKLRLTVQNTLEPVTIQRGDIIGTMSTYQLIALESKVINGLTLLDAIIGYLDINTQLITGLPPFKTYIFQPTGQFVANDLESLVVGDEHVELTTVMNPDREKEDDFLLRRYVNGLIKIYTGNGILGYQNPTATTMTYTCISYDVDLRAKIVDSVQLAINLRIESTQILTLPAEALTREEVRHSAMYYQPDGKLVQDLDYSAHIIKNFGGLVYDALDYNTDPDQEIVILKHPNFGQATTEENNLNAIKASVDARRGMGIKINYYLLDPTEGITWRPIMYVDGIRFTTAMQAAVETFLTSRTLKLFVAETTITAVELATELSSLFKTQFTPDDNAEAVTIPFLGFFQYLGVQLQIRATN